MVCIAGYCPHFSFKSMFEEASFTLVGIHKFFNVFHNFLGQLLFSLILILTKSFLAFFLLKASAIFLSRLYSVKLSEVFCSLYCFHALSLLCLGISEFVWFVKELTYCGCCLFTSL